MPLVLAKVYYSASEAEVAKSSLEAAGIPAYLFNKHLNRAAPYLNVALGGINLMVSDHDLEDVRGLLALEYETSSSLETESEAFKRNLPSGIMGFLASILMAWMPWWSRSRKYKDNVKD